MRYKIVILLKPDVFARRCWGVAMAWLQARTDITIVGMQFHPVAPDNLIRQHYLEHKGKDFYSNLMGFMHSGPTCAIAAWTDDIAAVRKEIAKFREDMGAKGPANLLHCSDSEISGEREWFIWFGSK